MCLGLCIHLLLSLYTQVMLVALKETNTIFWIMNSFDLISLILYYHSWLSTKLHFVIKCMIWHKSSYRVHAYRHIAVTNLTGGTQYHSWLMHYATSQKAVGLSPNEVTDLFSISNSSNCPRVNSASNRDEYQKMFLGSRVQTTCKANNLTAICEPHV
jgi:hypothetical protein